MAIDVFFYCKFRIEKLDEVVERVCSDRPDLFSYSFLFSSVKSMDEVDKEIATESGLFGGQSIVLLRLNEKSLADRLREVVDVVRSYFEDGSVLALMDGEHKI